MNFKENYNKNMVNKYMEKGMKKGFQVMFYAGDFLGREDMGQLYIREDCIEIKKGAILHNEVFAVIPFADIESINAGEEGGLLVKHVQVSINAKDNYYNIKFNNGGLNEVMPVIELLEEKVNASQVNEDNIASENNNTTEDNNSGLDELLKAKELLEAGLLTEEEFYELKYKILDNI